MIDQSVALLIEQLDAIESCTIEEVSVLAKLVQKITETIERNHENLYFEDAPIPPDTGSLQICGRLMHHAGDLFVEAANSNDPQDATIRIARARQAIAAGTCLSDNAYSQFRQEDDFLG